MIVDQGKVPLLDAQASYLAGCYWALVAGNITPNYADVWAAFVANEAAWGGYGRQLVGTMNAAALASSNGKAVAGPVTLPTFLNTTGSPQTFFMWALIDAGASKLIAWTNIGATVIPAGSNYVLNPLVTDTQL